MEKILFVNACMRGKEESRTFKLAQAFLEEYKSTHKCQVEEVDLTNTVLAYLNNESLTKRDNILADKDFDSPELTLAKQFAAAHKIVIAAPFWDLSFPAALKVFFENIFVNGITFAYDERGNIINCCEATKMMFITTRGGIFSTGPAQEFEMATSYLKTLSRFFGMADFQCVFAEGLDIVTNDAEALLAAAKSEAIAAARNF